MKRVLCAAGALALGAGAGACADDFEWDACEGGKAPTFELRVEDAEGQPFVAVNRRVRFPAGGQVAVRADVETSRSSRPPSLQVEAPLVAEEAGDRLLVSSATAGSGQLVARDGCGNQSALRLEAVAPTLRLEEQLPQWVVELPMAMRRLGHALVVGAELHLDATWVDAEGKALDGSRQVSFLPSENLQVEQVAPNRYRVRAIDPPGLAWILVEEDGTRFEYDLTASNSTQSIALWGERGAIHERLEGEPGDQFTIDLVPYGPGGKVLVGESVSVARTGEGTVHRVEPENPNRVFLEIRTWGTTTYTFTVGGMTRALEVVAQELEPEPEPELD